MLQIFKSTDSGLTTLDQVEDGAWINLVNPNEQEILFISKDLNIPAEHLKAALDEEERSRIEVDEGCTVVLIDIPVPSANLQDGGIFYTIPLGIIITGKNIVTVSLQENYVIKSFIDQRIKSFYTFKKTRFLLQILYRNSKLYLQYLRHIDKASDKIESKLHKSLKNKELIQLLELEKSLVYFSTSLKSNEIVLEKILRSTPVKMYPDDTDLLEDVIVENKQAIEMANIYSNILTGTMDAYASVISNNLNIVMKFLTSVTIVLSVPTMVASFFGMNVDVPFENNPHAFVIIFIMTLFFSLILAITMLRKQLF
ncbi:MULTISPECIES: magnesium transporter CorA family protein [Methanosarcina]|uniref:Magnesium and cobalt transport protein CorA n=3 Tax=Methanosarcina barkeri TaxID=2208 RepID=A0A0E3QYB0_METBA|nr:MULTISPECIES: magnesium transporter CorA family protein [Methanosarcina]AKB55800.1 Magnesium and cobalt transport protein CorA [Methanosarcina barkeri MS]AKB59275.1 Magnesium and cobalt transport protein CorA [Methanosarcina barkeri 227]AKJ39935.1 CorA-like Mg2+ transporter protein [Methanosarcina barkeri CM1]OEC90920.1 magnesium transporter [Methanosarcina sp. A14]